jgi:uncharacterized membrane protein
MKPIVFFSRTGCLLPLLIILNLFFGWIFFKPLEWLAVGLILVLLFMLSSIILTRKIFSVSSKDKRIIDVEGEVLDDKHKLT